MDRLLTVDELAEQWSSSRRVIYRLISDGKLKSLIIGKGSRRIPESEAERYVREQLETSPKPEAYWWQNNEKVPEKVGRDTLEREIRHAVTDPELGKKLEGSDAYHGAKLFIEAIDKAQAEAEGRELKTWKGAKSAQDIRDWLWGVAQQIKREHPDFSPMWRRVWETDGEIEWADDGVLPQAAAPI